MGQLQPPWLVLTLMLSQLRILVPSVAVGLEPGGQPCRSGCPCGVSMLLLRVEDAPASHRTAVFVAHESCWQEREP